MYKTQTDFGQTHNFGVAPERRTYACLLDYERQEHNEDEDYMLDYEPEENIEDEDYTSLIPEKDKPYYMKMFVNRHVTTIKTEFYGKTNQEIITFLDDYLRYILQTQHGKNIFEQIVQSLVENRDFPEYSPELFITYLLQTNFFKEKEEFIKDCFGNILAEAVKNLNFDLIEMFGKKPFKKLYDPNKKYGIDRDTLCHLALRVTEDEKLLRYIIKHIKTNPYLANNRGIYPVDLIIDNTEKLVDVFANYCLSIKKEDREKSPTFRILKERFKTVFLKYWESCLRRQSLKSKRNPNPIFMERIRSIPEPTAKLKLPPLKLMPRSSKNLHKGKLNKEPITRNFGTNKSIKKPLLPLPDPSQNLGGAIDELDKKTTQIQRRER